MTRVVPALIVLAIVALMAATAGHPTAPVPATVNAKPVSAERSNVTGTAVSFNSRRKNETARQKARRIITATWPSSQVDNAMRVVKCETGGTYSQWALGDGGNSVSWFQIHLPSHPWVNRARARNNPWYASRAALRIWRESGWRAWTCARILGIA